MHSDTTGQSFARTQADRATSASGSETENRCDAPLPASPAQAKEERLVDAGANGPLLQPKSASRHSIDPMRMTDRYRLVHPVNVPT